MSKTRVVPFEACHLDLIEIAKPNPEQILKNRSKYEALARLGLAGTIIHDGRILGVMGFFENWPGNYEVWAISSVYVAMHPRVYLKTIRSTLDSIACSHPVKRFQSPAVADEFHSKWMRFMGFENETPQGMKCYIDDTTYNLWGRVNHGRPSGAISQ